MAAHYNSKLSEIVPCQTNNKGFAIHPHFVPEEDVVMQYVNHRTGDDFEYDLDISKNMVKEAKAHAEAFNNPLTKNNALVFIHPFYVALSHWHELSGNRVEKEVEEYTKTVASLLKKNMSTRTADFVVMDTIEHYCSVTSSLLEYGYIDAVIFTHHNKGVPLNKKDLKKVNAQSVFAIGGYEGCCFDSALRYLRKQAKPKEIFGVQPLILSSPQSNFTTLHVDQTNELDYDQMISLDELVEKTGLNL